ncbi:aldo/keto reductase [Truepera radiovictrix]|uniref:Aldo/keto reductase n=1 Tax=Truepera radiovictrix (strain DSM 17093 / CIP 108686 / LMG 22925 / RQ-24) TaxID=649638 RepID=D7CQG4_TRURR|nr:aldo/keto reductase [Truepera radiovictrix]ADI14948.1 aldo/keto reductase [Truepera radiovictrix DSM 17093]WMT56497.1 aldo/keto reductase [Truepera radiovictrix]
MNQRYLGRTGLKVSELCLGAMTFGREHEATEAESHAMLDRFVAAGGTFIDTANVYSQGVSEEILGRWLAHQAREGLVIATKVRFPMGDGPNEVGLSRKHILASVEASLRRLNTDYIDLYQVHCWDERTPLEETLSTLNTLVERGWVRYLGVSNFSGWQLQKALDLARARGWEPFVCLQPQYNLLCRSTEWELLPVARREGLGVIPWSPLRGGWLSGKFRRGMAAPVAGSRIERAEKEGWSESWSAYNNEHTWGVIDALVAVAEEVGRTPAQVAINWLLQRPGVTAPIIGARTMEQLEANLGAVGWRLSPEQMARLDAASAVTPPYPYDVIAGAQARR